MIKPKPSLTETLCTRCGLCCDGSLFADVELATSDEAAALEVMGLEIEDDDGGLLLQPCAALRGKCCSIYAHRPACCRTFECRLLQAVRLGMVPVDEAKGKIAETLRQVERIKKLIAQLGQKHAPLPLKERCEEALSRSESLPADPKVKSRRAELQTTMAALENLIQKTFLGH